MPSLSHRFAPPWRRNHHLPLFALSDLARGLRSANESAIRALCANAYLGDQTALCRVLGRYKLFVDTDDVGLSSHLLLDGYWEMWLTELIARSVRPGMVVADIGANLGYFSVLMADLAGPSGRMHAFEPNARIAARLRKSVDANGYDAWSTVHEQALGEDDALFRLVVPAGEPKNGHLMPAAPEEEGLPDVVRTRRLDSYPELLDLDLVKIDADTAEIAIWRGMRGILERRRPLTVFLEFNPQRYPDARGFLEEMLAWGFTLAQIDLVRGAVRSTVDDVLADPAPVDRMLMMTR